jgi:hypothetical protein
MLERDENSRHWLFTVVYILLALAWLCWAGQFQPEWKGWKTDKEMRQETVAFKKMLTFIKPIEMRAYRMGRKYTPKQFYSDLRKIELMDEKLRHPLYPTSGHDVCSTIESALSDRIMRNIQFNPDLQLERERELVKYGKWKQKNIHSSDPFEAWTGEVILHWLWVFYLRAIVLFCFTFLIRMMRRDGLVPMLRKYPLRTVVASTLWPIYWGSFPYEVFREWKIEAQMRRIGPLLRTLTKREKDEIRRVTNLNTAEYRRWQKRYCSSHKFRHSLVVALAATLLLSIFACCCFAFSGGGQTDKYGVIISARGDPVLDGGGSSGAIGFEGLIPVKFEPDKLISFWIIPPLVEETRDRQDAIEHIPDNGWLVRLVRIQSAGGSLRQIKGESHEKVYVSDRSCSNRAAPPVFRD